MLKKLFHNLLDSLFRKNSGICREFSDRKFSFIYFTAEHRKDIEKFLGCMYDFDFTENGVIIWDEESITITGLVRSYFFPYNCYIIKNSDFIFYVSKDEFFRKYEIMK